MRGGIYNKIQPEPKGNPKGQAQGISRGPSPRDFLRAQAIFYCIS